MKIRIHIYIDSVEGEIMEEEARARIQIGQELGLTPLQAGLTISKGVVVGVSSHQAKQEEEEATKSVIRTLSTQYRRTGIKLSPKDRKWLRALKKQLQPMR